MQPVYSLVVAHEFVKVHKPEELFAACAAAGIGIVEATLGMEWRDDGPYLRVEVTRRVPKDRQKPVNAGLADTPEAREARVEAYRNWYAPILEKYPDRSDRDTTDHGSPWN